MGLLATCLLPLLAPQAPTTTTTTPTPLPVVAASSQDPVDLGPLRAAEADDAKADPAALLHFANGSDAALAARAAWLLARGKHADRLPMLRQVVAESPHAAARLQAMQALLHQREVGSTTTATAALHDTDRRIRTLAAQLLGALNRPTAREPLLALLQEQQHAEPGIATDVQAALLALHDLGANDLLLRAATAVHGGNAEGVGPTLAFCLQQMAPKLDREQQLMLALGMLDHREPLARRFAIDAVAGLGDPSTAKALEGRLANETPELRPLVEVALAHLRQDAAHDPERATLMDKLHGLDQRAKAWWQQSSTVERGVVVSVPLAVLLLLLLTLRRRGNAASPASDHADAEAAAALVQPSADLDTPEQLAADLATDPETAWGEAEPALEDANEQPADSEATFAEEVPADEFAPETQTSEGEPTETGGFDETTTELEVVTDGEATGWQDDAGPAR